jgi:hypothetical protein
MRSTSCGAAHRRGTADRGVSGDRLPIGPHRQARRHRRRPDVWEVVRDLKDAASQGAQDPIEAGAGVTGLDRSKVELAGTYYAAYPADIDERMRMQQEAAERLRRALGIPPAA